MIDNNPAAGIAPEKIIDCIEDIRVYYLNHLYANAAGI
jgi:hypothetical protein